MLLLPLSSSQAQYPPNSSTSFPQVVQRGRGWDCCQFRIVHFCCSMLLQHGVLPIGYNPS